MITPPEDFFLIKKSCANLKQKPIGKILCRSKVRRFKKNVPVVVKKHLLTFSTEQG